MDVGESWAYRVRGVDPLVEVRVVRVGTQKPARVLVRFVDEEFEGREDWVPPARLKVPWKDVDEFRTKEDRWNRIYAAGPGRDDPREDAAGEVFELLIDPELASLGYHTGGSISITRPEALALELGLELEQLVGDPDAFIEDGAVIAPWPVTELVIRAAIQRNPEPVLQRVWSEEAQTRNEAIHGRHSAMRRGESYYVSPERCVEFDNEYAKPIREVLRSWCGTDAIERFDELVELRKEIRRVGDVAQRAIDALRYSGRESHAAELERELGTPVEMLRHGDEQE